MSLAGNTRPADSLNSIRLNSIRRAGFRRSPRAAGIVDAGEDT
jgi:hypothetical protein